MHGFPILIPVVLLAAIAAASMAVDWGAIARGEIGRAHV